MDSIFDKISTLVNAQINDFLGRNPKSPLARIKLEASEIEENPRRTVKSLRERLDEALAYEDDIEAKIQRITQDAMDLDEQADQLVKAGDEFGARRVLSQLQLKQQQLSIAEAELRDHRLLTQHLMQEMTTLEMALDSQERQKSKPVNRSGSQSGATRIPIEGESSGRSERTASDTNKKSLRDAMQDRIDETRSTFESLLNNSPVPKPNDISDRFEKYDIVDEVPDPRTPKSEKKDKGEMKDRLSRLSKPDDEE